MKHAIAHTLRRAAQALRLIADQFDPPAAPATTWTDGWTTSNGNTNSGWIATHR